ncbi:MAG: phage shock protein operon transcriptional activator [bacterium]|nr:phage shock protein operon transcriptional activator [bacterium]
MSNAAARPPNPEPPVQALGESEAFLALQERISRAAATDRPVIFIGERGTGKELAARRLHLLSPRWNQPYVTLNCASLSPTLIESELFGHEAGAFTGATRLRKGRFEMADGGTLFLDEVANIPMTVQEKILRVVEYGTMERVGSSATLRIDARLVAATNADLRAAARAGAFRQDLLDRLSFEVIVLPPLRRREGDILLLAGHFARRMAAELGRAEAPVFTPRAARALAEYPWPGNVRELKNAVERMVYRAAGPEIDEIAFDPFEFAELPTAPPIAPESPGTPELYGTPKNPGAPPSLAAHPTDKGLPDLPGLDPGELARLPLPEAVTRLEVARLRVALSAAGENQRRAAALLGLSYDQFRGLYRKHRAALRGARP